MTDEQAKALGERALGVAGHPPRGVLWRITHTETGPQSWPDLRDEITEAWLVAWGLKKAGLDYNVDERAPLFSSARWSVSLVWYEEKINSEGGCRAEAWVSVLEKLKEKQS